MKSFAALWQRSPGERPGRWTDSVKAALRWGTEDATELRRDPPMTWMAARSGLFARGAGSNAVVEQGESILVGDIRLDQRSRLIRDLKADGLHLPPSTSDEQLAVGAWNTWGLSGLARLHGDFAFVIRQRSKGILVAVRDPFGIRPLYWAEPERDVLVSNRLDPILRHPEVDRQKDALGILDYLMFDGNFEWDGTIWRSIRRVPAGHAVIWSADDRRLVRFHEPQMPDAREMSPKARIERLSVDLLAAVKDRALSGETAPAISMSGGLDSTALAAVAVEAGMRPETHTLIYQRAIDDPEGPVAATTAEFLGVSHRSHVMDGYALYSKWRELPRFPMPGDPMVDAIYHDFDRAVLKSGQVIWTGWGGDPLLLPERGLWRRRMRGAAPHLLLRDLWRAGKVGRLLPLGLRSRREKRALERNWRRGFPSWLNPDFARRHGAEERWRRILLEGGPLPGEVPERRPEAYRHTYDLQWSHVFERIDAGNRGLPLVRRHPFFDARVIEACLSAPTSPWCLHKYLLRQAMVGRLPEATRARPKSPQLGNPQHPVEDSPLDLWREWSRRAPELAEYLCFETVERALMADLAGGASEMSLNVTWRRPLNLAMWLAQWVE